MRRQLAVLLAAAAHGWRLSRPRAPLLNLRIKRPRTELPPAPPALFTAEDARPVVLFDGECNLCNWGVNLILDLDRCSKDKRGNLRVGALQSAVGQALVGRLPEDDRRRVAPDDATFSTIVVAGESDYWIGSNAVLKIGRQLRGPLRYLSLLGSLVPRFLRDWLYYQLSKRRKAWFGEASQCRLWDDHWDERFVGEISGAA